MNSQLRIVALNDDPRLVSLLQTELFQPGAEAPSKNQVDVKVSTTDEGLDGQADLFLLCGIPMHGGVQRILRRVHERNPGATLVILSDDCTEGIVNSSEFYGDVECLKWGDVQRLQAIVSHGIQLKTLASENERLKRKSDQLERLLKAVQDLSLARGIQQIMDVVKYAARELVEADGATFVLREGDKCFYAEEHAIAPLWKGHRFPLEDCIGGWVMAHKERVAIEDVYQDSRIPHDVYQPTFVKSLAIVPIRMESPIGTIGTYWSEKHSCSPEELELLQALADTTSVAMENVTLYAELEQRVKARTVQLQVANEELDAFTYAVSHDLRSPARRVGALASALLKQYRECLDDEGERFLANICATADEMKELIDALLKLSKITMSDIHATDVDINSLVDKIVSRLRLVYAHRDIEVVIAPSLHAFGDPKLLEIALTNLLSNAWKYTENQSHARIDIGSQPGETGPIYYVRDNGIGFDMEKAHQLFTPFRRLENAQGIEGKGIGLATVRRIIKRHGGDLWAESRPGEGATFYFTLNEAR